MKTVREVLKKAKDMDYLQAGKRFWKVEKRKGFDTVAMPIKNIDDWRSPKNGFELWQDCEMEKVVVIPNLKIIKLSEEERFDAAKKEAERLLKKLATNKITT